MADEVVRVLKISAKTDGVDQTTASINNLTTATNNLAEVTDTSAKRALSAEAAYKRQTLSIDPAARALDSIAKATKTADAALAQGIITQDQHSKRLDDINKKYTTQVGASAALGKATQALQLQMAAFAGGLGLAGQVLTAFGPWGFAAAIGLGVVSAALNFISDSTHALAQKAKEIYEFSEATGLTTYQFQALRSEAGKFGIDSETLAKGLSKFTVGFDALRLGSGQLLVDIRKINPALADQIAAAKDSATAFTLFGKAVAATDNIFQRNALLKAGLGKGSAQYGGLLSSGIDVAQLGQDYEAAGKGIDENLIKKLKQLQIEIDKTRSAANTVFATAFGTSTLEGEKKYAEVLLDIAKTFKTIADYISATPEWVKTIGGVMQWVAEHGNPASGLLAGAKAGISAGASAYDAANVPDYSAGGEYDGVGNGKVGVVPTATGKTTAQYDIAKQKIIIGLMGDTATAAQKLTLKLAELNLGQEGVKLSGTTLAKAEQSIILDSQITQAGLYSSALGQSLPILDQVNQRMAQLQKLQMQGAGLSSSQIEFQRKLATSQALGTFQIDAQTAAEKVKFATLGMTTEAATSYEIVATKVNEAIALGKPLNGQQIQQLQQSADAYAKAKVQGELYADTVNTLKDSFNDLGHAMFEAALSGKNGMDALVSTLDNVAKKLADKAFDNLLTGALSGNAVQMGVGAAQAGASALIGVFTKDQKAKKELEEVQAAWAGMSDQIHVFNETEEANK